MHLYAACGGDEAPDEVVMFEFDLNNRENNPG
jgi:hypothetical protein